MTHMLATVQVKYGKVPQFCEILSHLIPILERRGWRLIGAYTTSVGRLFKVYDLWEIPDSNSFGSVLDQALEEPEFREWSAQLENCVEAEEVELLDKLPYSP